MTRRFGIAWLVAAVWLYVVPGEVQAQTGLPEPLQKVGFDQRLGESVPLDLEFSDAEGSLVLLKDLVAEKPVILSLVYYDCPMLCPMVMNGLTAALKVMDFEVGKEFDVVVVSIDSRESPEMASAVKADALHRYGRPEAERGWHFLTGGENSIRALTEAIGFRYTYVPESGEFAHAAGIVALTPEGRIARYFYGVEYSARDLRLGLVEAAENEIGSLVDQVLLYCYHYDPVTGSYSAVAMNIVRLGAIVTVLLIAIFLIAQWRLEKRRQPAAAKA